MSVSLQPVSTRFVYDLELTSSTEYVDAVASRGFRYATLFSIWSSRVVVNADTGANSILHAWRDKTAEQTTASWQDFLKGPTFLLGFTCMRTYTHSIKPSVAPHHIGGALLLDLARHYCRFKCGYCDRVSPYVSFSRCLWPCY